MTQKILAAHAGLSEVEAITALNTFHRTGFDPDKMYSLI